jgi:hypothetical protein
MSIKLKSESIFPPSTRKSATKEQTLEAYLMLEQLIISVLDDNSAKLYEVYTAQLEKITKQISALDIDIETENNPALDVFIRMLERLKPTTEGLKHVRENSKLSLLLEGKTNSTLMRHVKNNVND